MITKCHVYNNINLNLITKHNIFLGLKVKLIIIYTILLKKDYLDFTVLLLLLFIDKARRGPNQTCVC